jgi:hypothetical protein
VTLRDAIAKLDQLSDTAVLFAERLSGQFKPNSRTVLLELSDADLERPVVEIAAERAPGTEYFLEIDEAQRVVAGFVQSRADDQPSLDEVVERVIYYAENDA